jgi:hypothetical protein
MSEDSTVESKDFTLEMKESTIEKKKNRKSVLHNMQKHLITFIQSVIPKDI